jgi:hypothetical protein
MPRQIGVSQRLPFAGEDREAFDDLGIGRQLGAEDTGDGDSAGPQLYEKGLGDCAFAELLDHLIRR